MAQPGKDTKKHADFVNEPIGNKPVTALPGIGEKKGAILKDAGIDQASQVKGVYLVEKGDPQQFKAKMGDMGVKGTDRTYKGLNEHYNTFDK